MSLVSRREVIFRGMVTSAVTLLPEFLFTEKTNGLVPQASDLRINNLFSVEPISKSSTTVLDNLFPGLLLEQKFQQFIPVSFLVSNIGSKDIRAFSSHWTIAALPDMHEMNIMHYFHPREEANADMKMSWGQQGNETYFTGIVPAIRAGATRLVTPFFSWSSSFYKKNNKPAWDQILLFRRRRGLELAQLADGAVSMRVSAAITKDFVSIGTDDRLANAFCVTRNAEHDEAVSVLKNIAAGASQNQVIDQLYRDARGLDFDNDPQTKFYYRMRQRQAAALLGRIEDSNWGQFVETLQYLRNQPKTRKRTS
jgi:hypothetical protein